jgi:hypothetical protein
MLKVLHYGSLGLPISSSPSHMRLTVAPTHLSILSSSRLMLPKQRSSPSMISPSRSSNLTPSVTWISAGSPMAGIIPSSYPTPTSPSIFGHSTTTILPTIVIPRSMSPSTSPTTLHTYQLPSDLLGLSQNNGPFYGNYHPYTITSVPTNHP